MAKSWFLTLLIISALFSLSIIPQGHGRRMTAVRSASEIEEGGWEGRGMVEMTMDYKEPGANTNPRGGLAPPPSPSSS
ncbi:hypothetical protein Cni_G06293 [Canna indica]|uniref:Uncharacterized protein n=1 Tax=Canna indica TaxID=4628 RepID=A0AAQ3Q5T7_9LILI|nr:hypothetical protein Cni_G06293 [Canna indica]